MSEGVPQLKKRPPKIWGLIEAISAVSVTFHILASSSTKSLLEVLPACSGHKNCEPHILREPRSHLLYTGEASGLIRTDGLRFTNPLDSVPNSDFTYKIELLCQLGKYLFVRKVPASDSLFHSFR